MQQINLDIAKCSCEPAVLRSNRLDQIGMVQGIPRVKQAD